MITCVESINVKSRSSDMLSGFWLSSGLRIWPLDTLHGITIHDMALHEDSAEATDRLGYTGLSDKVCPPSTQYAVYNKVKSDKKMLLYHEYGHEYLPHLSDHAMNEFLQL
ncbi:UNVERIFIED_CONTAM: hypothetical protein ABIC26_000258 [Paenibacillus sp. PvR008]